MIYLEDSNYKAQLAGALNPREELSPESTPWTRLMRYIEGSKEQSFMKQTLREQTLRKHTFGEQTLRKQTLNI